MTVSQCVLKKAKVMNPAERSWLKFEDVSELGQWVGEKADGGQERLRWGGGPHLTILRGRGSATWYTIIFTYIHFCNWNSIVSIYLAHYGMAYLLVTSLYLQYGNFTKIHK